MSLMVFVIISAILLDYFLIVFRSIHFLCSLFLVDIDLLVLFMSCTALLFKMRLMTLSVESLKCSLKIKTNRYISLLQLMKVHLNYQSFSITTCLKHVHYLC